MNVRFARLIGTALASIAVSAGTAHAAQSKGLAPQCMENYEGKQEKRCLVMSLAAENEFEIDAGLAYLCSSTGRDAVQLRIRARDGSMSTERTQKLELWWNQQSLEKFDVAKIDTKDDTDNPGKTHYQYSFTEEARGEFLKQIQRRDYAWLRAPTTGEERQRLGETAWIGFVFDEKDTAGAIAATMRECGIAPEPEEPAKTQSTGRRD